MKHKNDEGYAETLQKGVFKKGCSQGELYLNDDKLGSGNTKSGLKNMEEGGQKREPA